MKEYRYYRCSSSFKINPSPCPNHSWKAEYLENLIWQEVEAALSNPSVILAGIEALRVEASKADSQLEELAMIEARLIELDKQQQQLLQWALKGFPEETIVKENERINRDREGLKQREVEVKARIESAKQAQVDAESISETVELVKANLGDLSLEAKRLALEVLSIRVNLGSESITIEGALPVSFRSKETPSKRNGERMPSISCRWLEQVGQSMPLD
jgi:hypothetical protein